MFLKPIKITPRSEQLTLRAATDSTIVLIKGNNFQPAFLKNNEDTINFDFTIESVVFSSSSGNKLNGWLLKPKSIIPTITLLHFHGNSGFLVSQYQRVTPLLKYGFQIFMFDYSGYGFSEGKATRKNVLLDAHSALSYVKSRTDLQATKMVIYGQSLGGHLSAVVASNRQKEIDGLVVEGAFSSHKEIAKETAGILGKIFVSEKYSAIKSIKKFEKPILIVHSTEDNVIQFKMGKDLFENANFPKEFFEIKGCHICGPQLYAETLSKKIRQVVK
jgi:fermentation-respiration switch protein FrsA (DUF1100 family)